MHATPLSLLNCSILNAHNYLNSLTNSLRFSRINESFITDDEPIIVETAETENFSKPSEIHDSFFVFYIVETDEEGAPPTLGKWMVFKHYDEVDEAWENIRTAVAKDELQGCLSAACSTMMYHPTLEGPGPSTNSVICVYTKEHNMDAIGFKLIEIVKQDIKYKTDEDSRNYKYTHAGSGKVSIKTIFWNNGKPSFECKDKPCYGTSFKKDDIWQLNVVTAPEPFCSEEVHGRWIMYLEYEELTGLWHHLKNIIETKEKNFGIVRMVCPPKRVRRSPTESPVFHVYTGLKAYRSVGKKLIEYTESDIDYERKPGGYGNMRGVVETLYWNEGEPDYERIRRKGITKNWRTGEELS